jgi:hypothetical protein
MFKEQKSRGKTCSYEDLEELDSLDFKDNKVRGLVNINMKEGFRGLVSSKLRTSSPYDYFVTKSNYLILFAADKTNFIIYKDRDGVYEYLSSLEEYYDSFEELKKLLKTTNLPEEIKGDDMNSLEFVYKDYKAKISTDEVEKVLY